MDLIKPFRLLPVVLMLFSVSVSALDRGPFAAFSYSTSGTGYLYAPSPARSSGEYTKPESSSVFSSASRLYISGGYYYDFLQGDLSYTRTSIKNQTTGLSYDKELKSGTDSSVLLRAGYRFSIPGDTSYSWFFLGLKRYGYDAFGGTAVTAYGWLAGYSGFYSFGLSSNIEFVIAVDTYLGTYRFDDFSSDSGYTGVSKKYSVTAGAGIGAGVQYEPYNITLLFKISADTSRIAYDANYQGSSRKVMGGSSSVCAGFEIRYVIPDESYNEKIK